MNFVKERTDRTMDALRSARKEREAFFRNVSALVRERTRDAMKLIKGARGGP